MHSKSFLLKPILFGLLFLFCSQSNFASGVEKKLAALELSSGGRMGIAAINTANNQQIQYRANERFPFKSTFKIIGVAAILKLSTSDPHLMQQHIIYTSKDLVAFSPITEKHVTDGMTISDLCAATIEYSDNTASNLLMKKLGGPEAVTLFVRMLGDTNFNLSSWEPNLNSDPKNPEDTSTPAAMNATLQKLIFSNALTTNERQHLINWMKNNTTGNAAIRAAVPKTWIVADKTGSGFFGITNDIAILWPPHGAPIVLSLFFIQNSKDAKIRNDVLASAASILLDEFAAQDNRLKH